MQKHSMYTRDRQVIQHSVNKDASVINSTLFRLVIIRASLSVVTFLIVIYLLFVPQISQALMTGISGYSGNPATNSGQTCVLCHNGGIIPSISISGPSVVTAYSVNTYTLTLSGGQVNQGGVNISTDSGILFVGSNTGIRLDTGSGELVHSQPATGSNLTWTFNWQAPSSPGSATLFYTGLSSNNDANLTGDNAASSSFVITVTSGVNQAPVPIIIAPPAGIEGVPVTFDGITSTDSDGLITTYNWDFADGTTDTGSVVNHLFAVGTFNVSLTVIDDSGLEATVVHQITILSGDQNQLPIASAGGPYHGVVGVPLTMDSTGSIDADGVINRFLWDFGDGGTFVEGATVTHVYNTIGNYILTLAATDNDGLTGAAATSVTIIEGSPPIANAGGPYSGEVGLAITFDAGASSDSDGTLVEYNWNLGDGSTLNGVAVSHVYASTGNFTVTLKVIDNDGLTATASTTVDIISASNTALGKTLYDANCALCHGPGGTGGAFVAVTGASASLITSSISSIGAMNNINLSTTEIQAIADYLAGSTGGGSGGGTGTSTGQTLYDANCASCHGPGGTGGAFVAVTGASASLITGSISSIGAMNNINLSTTEIQAIADYLAGSTGGGGSTKPTDGQGLYIVYCSVCHGTNGVGGPEESVTGASSNSINSAVREKSEMRYLASVLTAQDVELIAEFLRSSGGGEGD